MYYEDLGLYFHDTDLFNVENPATRDELWQSYSTTDASDYPSYFICVEFSVKGLTADEIADLEWEIRASFPSGEYYTYTDELNNDTGDREIGGLAGSNTYGDILSILRAYDVKDLTDRTTYA